MYVKESGLTQVLDVIGQGYQFIGDRVGFADQVMREKAKSDLFYAEAEFNKNTQDFLRDLSQKGDYENFGKYLDDYLTKSNAELQKKASNHYTGQLFNQMITSQRNALQNTVQNQILAMSINDITTQNQGTMELNRNNLKGQAGINANNGVINSEYANGMRDAKYTHAALLNDGKLNIQKDMYTNASTAMEQIFKKNGGSFSEVEKLVDDMAINSDYQIMMLDSRYASEKGLEAAEKEPDKAYINIGDEIDKKEIAKDVKKLLKNQWDTKLNEMQEKNMGLITEMFNKMYTLPESQRLEFANYALNYIDTNMSGNNLSPSQRAQAVNFFKSYKETGTGSAAEKRTQKQYEDFIEVSQEFYIDRYLDGTLDPYQAEKAFRTKCFGEYKKVYGKESEFDMESDFPVINGFLDALYKKAPDQIKGIVKDSVKFIEKFAKDNKLNNSEELQGAIIDFTWDMLSEIKLSDPKAIEKAAKYLQTELNSLDGKKLDIVRKNMVTGNSDLQVGVLRNSDETLAEYLYEIEKHEGFRYKNRYGIEKTSVFGSDETFEVADKMQREFLQKNLGIEPGDLKQSYEVATKTNKLGMTEYNRNDVTSNMVYTAPDGTQYKVRSADKKDIDIYKRAPNGEWEKVLTKKQEAKVDKKEKNQEARSNLIEKTKEIESKSDAIADYLIKNPDIKIPGINVTAGSGKGKKKESLAQDIKHYLQKYEDNDMNPKKKAAFEAWLKENGFTTS